MPAANTRIPTIHDALPGPPTAPPAPHAEGVPVDGVIAQPAFAFAPAHGDIEAAAARRPRANNKEFTVKHASMLATGIVAAIVVMITVTESFHYVYYDEMAFVKHRYGELDKSQVKVQGRYFLPLWQTLIKYPTTFTAVNFEAENRLAVANSDGLQFFMDATLYYRLKPS